MISIKAIHVYKIYSLNFQRILVHLTLRLKTEGTVLKRNVKL